MVRHGVIENRYCQRCERPSAVVEWQIPYLDNRVFATSRCNLCGFGVLLRDDLCPDIEGRVLARPRWERGVDTTFSEDDIRE